MNVVEAALRRAVVDLDRTGYAWALVGGFAVSAQAEPRFTRDVDIAVAVPDDRGAEEMVRSFTANGYHLKASVEQNATGRLATVRLTHPDVGDVVIDILFASSGIEPEIVESAEVLEMLPGLTVPVARIGHLIATKLLARDDQTRPQDLSDLRALRAVADVTERNLARDAIKLIADRGFHRDRNLEVELTEYLDV